MPHAIHAMVSNHAIFCVLWFTYPSCSLAVDELSSIDSQKPAIVSNNLPGNPPLVRKVDSQMTHLVVDSSSSFTEIRDLNTSSKQGDTDLHNDADLLEQGENQNGSSLSKQSAKMVSVFHHNQEEGAVFFWRRRRAPPASTTPKPINCRWGNWGRWSECSRSCGAGGEKVRRRIIAAEAQYDGTCEGASEGTKTCFEKDCPQLTTTAAPTTTTMPIHTTEKEDDEKKAPGGVPLTYVIVGAVVLIVLVGGGAAFALKQKKDGMRRRRGPNHGNDPFADCDDDY